MGKNNLIPQQPIRCILGSLLRSRNAYWLASLQKRKEIKSEINENSHFQNSKQNKQFAPSDLAGAFSLLASLLDDHLSKNPESGGLKEMLLYRKATKFQEFLPKLKTSAEKDIALVLLYQMTDSREIQQEVQRHTELNMQDFKTPRAAFQFVDAVIESGAFTEAKTTVCVLGNTNAGKSSLVRTLRDFCSNTRKKKPIPNLTEDNTEFLATKVLELVEDVDVRAQQVIKLEIKPDKNNSKLNYVTNTQGLPPPKENDSLKIPTEKLKVTFADFAGHTQYESCSSLFTTENGVYMIAFDAPKYLEVEAAQILDPYHPSIGTYLELITRSCPEPIIMLVATKTELCPAEKYDSILKTAKAHLKSIVSRSSRLKRVVLFDEVIKTSSAEGTRENFEDLCGKVFAVCSHKELLNVRERTHPMSWKKMMDGTKVHVKMTLHQIQEAYDSIYSKCKKNEDTVTEGLEGWRAVAETVIALAELEAEATKQDIKDQIITIKNTADVQKDMTSIPLAGKDTFVMPAEEDQINRTLRTHDSEEPVVVNEEGEKQEVSWISEEVETILSVFSSSKEIFWFR